jgi:hypothetical protein
MFIASQHSTQDLAPLGAKTDASTFFGRQQRLRSYGAAEQTKDRRAINISPRWGEATDNLVVTSK